MRRLWRQWQRWRWMINRNNTLIRWLGLSSVEPTSESGLLLIQIDGLSRSQLEFAIQRKRMPFLRNLIKHQHYTLRTMYSGLPSTTPAVQGEIFYGVRCAVPAFGFRNPASDCVVNMVESEPAAEVERQLASQHRGLLSSGSAYTNIYAGGAAESHFCAATMGWNGMFDRATRRTWIAAILLHWPSVLRTLALMFVELGLGIFDAIAGRWSGQKLYSELKLIPSRVAVGVGLRELATIGASVDVTRGLNIVQLNFLGYDEQAHRRGPQSKFAHWSLKGIDKAIRRVVRAARSSNRRKYEVWIYSDHGQECATPYETKFGRSIQAAVAEAFGEPLAEMKDDTKPAAVRRMSRLQWLGPRRHSAREQPAEACSQSNSPSVSVEVVTPGPIGSVYLARPMDVEALDEFARRLVALAHVPAVLRPEGRDRAVAWTAAGRFALPEDVGEIVGPDHPFRSELAQDLVRWCHHPAAGQLLLYGWTRRGKDNLTFVDENGAHGGPGTAETHAFVLAPSISTLGTPERGFLRPEDFRRAVQEQLHRRPDVIDQRIDVSG